MPSCLTDLDELFDLSRAFSTLPLVKGVGMGVMAMDTCEEFGTEVVELSEEAMKGLHGISPLWEGFFNPLDVRPGV